MGFIKGKSGNPKGRPKKDNSFSEILEIALSKRKMNLTDSKKTIQGKEILANVLLDIATNEQAPFKIRLEAINTIIDRTDGKPLQSSTQEIIESSRPAEYMNDEDRLKAFQELMSK